MYHSDDGAQTDMRRPRGTAVTREEVCLFPVINFFVSRKLARRRDIRQLTPCLLFFQQHLCSGFLEEEKTNHSWDFKIAPGKTACFLIVSISILIISIILIIKIDYKQCNLKFHR